MRLHVSRDELEKKYILKKFFNFSEAFIIHAKISHSQTHTHMQLPLLSPTHTSELQANATKTILCEKRNPHTEN